GRHIVSAAALPRRRAPRLTGRAPAAQRSGHVHVSTRLRRLERSEPFLHRDSRDARHLAVHVERSEWGVRDRARAGRDERVLRRAWHLADTRPNVLSRMTRARPSRASWLAKDFGSSASRLTRSSLAAPSHSAVSP